MQQQRIPTETEWAWLAGVFEGEGTIAFAYYRSVRANIKMTDRDVLESFDRLVPSPGGVQPVNRKVKPHHKDQFRWEISSRDEVIAFLEGIYPWLHSRRRARTDEALKRLAANRGIYANKVHCRHGHVWAEVGVYTSPAGKRHCRACIREAQARYRTRHRERYLKQRREVARRYRQRQKEARLELDRTSQRGSKARV